jgi:hypothetical protein
MAILIDILSSSYLVLASIDRMLVTSANIRTKQRSTRRVACLSIISVTVFWILFHSHILYSANILKVAPNSSVCFFPSGIHLVLHSYYSLTVKACLIPLSMIVFGLLALKNIRKVGFSTVAPVLTTSGTILRNHLKSSRSKDRQFCLMLCSLILVVISFSA